MTISRLRRLSAVALVTLLLAAACGGDEGTDVTSESAADAASASSATDESDDTDHTHDDTDHTHDDTDHTHGDDGVDLSVFLDGAIVGESATVDCTLSDGTESTCVELTVAGYPVDEGVGDFCPETVDATADEVGIWFDGDGVYDLDGAFILGLAELYDDDAWALADADGVVNVTETQEAFEAAARPDVDPEYQNHCVEGQIEWLPDGEPITTTVLLPLEPVTSQSKSPATQCTEIQ